MLKILTTLAMMAFLPITSFSEKITFDDLYSFANIRHPSISPNGSQIAFDTKTFDTSIDSAFYHIWLIDIDGNNLRRLTSDTFEAENPKWSPDGKQIACLSTDDDGDQIWFLSVNGKERSKATKLSSEVSDYLWSPDGSRLILVSKVYPDCPNDDCHKARIDSVDSNRVEARLYDHLMYRHYKTWDKGKRKQLFVYDIAGDSTYRLTRENYDIPTATLGGDVDFTVSPDGKEICYVANIDSILTLSTDNNLFTISLDNHLKGGVKITEGKGQDHSPAYSPDGRFIAYISQARAGYESDQNELMLYDRHNGLHINLTSGFDLHINDYIWDPQSENIYFRAISHGFNMLWKVDINTGKIENILSDAVYKYLSISPDGGRIVLTRSLSDQPYELYSYDINSDSIKQLTYFSEESLNKLTMNRAQEFWFEGSFGDSVHGFLTLPPYFDSTRKYPLVLMIHGGPQWCWLGDFNYYGWNTQLTAAQGYVVAQIDPHGSVGYGLEFKEYVSGNWGKGDYDDLMLGIDYLLGKYRFIDSTRMGAMGRSYGGFMANWICGHSDRFKCLVSVDGTFDQISEYYATDELWFPEWETKGTPYTNRDEYIRSSPSSYVQNFKTPTMVLHGQKDYRVDVSQGLQMFTALQRMGVPSWLLYYPDEGHSLKKAYNLRYAYQKQFEWLAKWLKPE
jgi:dipeptidyl aminopeptidase/acylaminoacyl peptidase